MKKSSVPPSIADLLEATTRELAGTDARVYRRVGAHISRTAKAAEDLGEASASSTKPVKALPLCGSFEKQTVKSLKHLCRTNGITKFSGLKKSLLIDLLKAHGYATTAGPPSNEESRADRARPEVNGVSAGIRCWSAFTSSLRSAPLRLQIP